MLSKRTWKLTTAFLSVSMISLLLGSTLAVQVSNPVVEKTKVGDYCLVECASYIIFKDDGGVTCAKNGTTGRIDYRSSNASSAIQNALENSVGKIHLSSGSYNLTWPLDMSDLSVGIEGNGPSSMLEGTCTLIQIRNSANHYGMSQSITNIGLDGSGSDNVALDLFKVDHNQFDNLYIVNAGIGIRLVASLDNSFKQVEVYGCDQGIRIENNDSSTSTPVPLLPYPNQNLFIGGAVESCRVGVTVAGWCDGNSFKDMAIQSCTEHQVLLETLNDGAVDFYPTQVSFIGCWFEGASPSIEFAMPAGSGTYANGCIFKNNIFTASMTGGTSWTAINLRGNNNLFSENNIKAAYSTDWPAGIFNINVQGVNNTLINNFATDTQYLRTINWNDTGYSNHFENNYYTSGTGAKVTVNSGTALIGSGNTSVVVGHGLWTAPLKCVLVSWLSPENQTLYVDNITNTTFTIKVLNPVGSVRGVAWYAQAHDS